VLASRPSPTFHLTRRRLPLQRQQGAAVGQQRAPLVLQVHGTIARAVPIARLPLCSLPLTTAAPSGLSHRATTGQSCPSRQLCHQGSDIERQRVLAGVLNKNVHTIGEFVPYTIFLAPGRPVHYKNHEWRSLGFPMSHIVDDSFILRLTRR
jgi:hypothetical protein